MHIPKLSSLWHSSWQPSLWIKAGLLALCASFSLLGCSITPSEVRIPSTQLQAALQERFPQKFPLAGLLEMELNTPQLDLLAQTNRIAAQVPIRIQGPVLSQPAQGTVSLDLGLRYHAPDHTIRADSVRVHQIQATGVPPAAARWLAQMGPGLLERVLQDLPLYRLDTKDLERLQKAGRQPGAITVDQDAICMALDRPSL